MASMGGGVGVDKSDNEAAYIAFLAVASPRLAA
jgi:hypothetical protein